MPAGRSSGAARSFCLQEAKAKRGGGWIAWPVENPSGPGGAAGAHSAHKAWAGALGPRPCFGFAGPSGPQNAAAPPARTPAPPSSPASAYRRRPNGGCSWEAGRPGRPRGGAAAFGRPGGGPRAAPRPAKQKARAGGKASGPALFRTLRVLPPPPLWVFHQRQKGNIKARPFI